MVYEGPGVPVFNRDQPGVSYMGSIAPDLLNVIIWVRTRRGGVEMLSQDFTDFTVDRSTKQLYLPRANNDGVVAAITVRGNGLALRGAFYMIITLQPDSPTQRILCADYLYRFRQPMLGTLVGPGPEGGPGLMRSIQIANPAAGTELSATVPANALWRLHSLRTVVVGGAAAYNPSLIVTDGTNIKWESGVVTIVGAATEPITWAMSGAFREADALSAVPIPINNFLPEGYVIETEGITADDDYGVGELLIEEWLVA